jgi:hypothetical protein
MDGDPEYKRYVVVAKNKDGPRSPRMIPFFFDDRTASFQRMGPA